MQLLVIDDDPLLGSQLQSFLPSEYQLTVTHSGRDGLAQLRQYTFDVTILDSDLPDLSGTSVCYFARQNGYTGPILALSGWDYVANKIELLNAGADDYVTKPFHPDELKARLKALHRRHCHQVAPKTVRWYHLTLDLETYELHFPNTTLKLPPKEAHILGLLLDHPGRVITREMIIDHIWTDSDTPQANTLDAHIKRLRALLNELPIDAEIQTIRSQGYRWQPLPDLRILSQSPTMESEKVRPYGYP